MRHVGIGCFSAFAGFWSGGMIAVLVAKIVGSVRGCEASSTGAPCDWQLYAIVGMILGAITLPALVLWRLRRGRSEDTNLD